MGVNLICTEVKNSNPQIYDFISGTAPSGIPEKEMPLL